MTPCQKPGAHPQTGPSGGFTLIELVLVLMVAGVLTTIALPSLRGYLARQDARDASQAFMLAAARARSAAVARAGLIRLRVDPEADLIQVVEPSGDVLHSVDLAGGQREADVVAEGIGGDESLNVLYTPRGFVDPGKEDGGLLPVRVGFSRGDHTVWTEMTVAGHVELE